jgi:pimeloyl-ACP methyl ester carboxylesterase
MISMSAWLIPVDGAELEVDDWGAGDPVVFIQTALTADEARPVATDSALQHGYRKIVYHRRGYAGSSPVRTAGSVARDASDCRALLAALHIERAHVFGFSYSGAVALQVAADSPEHVHTLTIVEPPPVHTPSAPEFRAANDRLMKARRSLGPQGVLDEFLSRLIGPNWRTDVETHLPGAVAQMQRDATTFFDVDLPALLAWRFGREDAHRIGCPVLHLGGSDSGPWFAEVRDLILDWLPQADDVMIDGGDHSLMLTHPQEVAAAFTRFASRYPITDHRARATGPPREPVEDVVERTSRRDGGPDG